MPLGDFFSGLLFCTGIDGSDDGVSGSAVFFYVGRVAWGPLVRPDIARVVPAVAQCLGEIEADDIGFAGVDSVLCVLGVHVLLVLLGLGLGLSVHVGSPGWEAQNSAISSEPDRVAWVTSSELGDTL